MDVFSVFSIVVALNLKTCDLVMSLSTSGSLFWLFAFILVLMSPAYLSLTLITLCVRDQLCM